MNSIDDWFLWVPYVDMSLRSAAHTDADIRLARAWQVGIAADGLLRFGRHLTEQLLPRGERVVGIVRKPTTVEDLAKAHPDGFCAEVLDVRDTAALRAVIDRTVADFGRIDVAISTTFGPNALVGFQVWCDEIP